MIYFVKYTNQIMSVLKSLEDLSSVIQIYRENNLPLNLSDNMKCLKCKKLLMNAVQTDCGCRYCSDCFESHSADGNKKCLGIDCEDFIKCVKDNAINKEIGKLKVECVYGCKVSNELRLISSHLEECTLKKIDCPECKEKIEKGKLKLHQESECKMRIVKCPHCNESMKLKYLQDSHLKIDYENVCSNYDDLCPYNCGELKIVNIKKHRAICTKKPIICPFSEIGCKSIVAQFQFNDHFTKEAFTHSTCIITEFKRINKKHNEEIQILKNNNEKLKKENEKLIEEINNLKRVSSTTSLSQSTTVTRTEGKAIYRNGTYIWKIENFSKLKNDAMNNSRISVTSDPFYTKEFGYKMSMKIYPAGDGVGKGTHLSVFFTIMKGEFDDLLAWPFKNKVTLTIMDQKNKSSDHSDTFKPDPKSTCYQQPIDEYNIASGSPKFIAFSQLEENFIKNDTIFLKIQVLS